MKKAYSTPKAPLSPKLLSQVVENDGLFFVSGQIHMDMDFKLVGEIMTEKAKKVMSNIEEILKAAELTFGDVLKVTVYVTDMKQYSEFNDVYLTYFEEPMPAREVVCVKELPLGADVEVSVIAKK